MSFISGPVDNTIYVQHVPGLILGLRPDNERRRYKVVTNELDCKSQSTVIFRWAVESDLPQNEALSKFGSKYQNFFQE